MFNKRNIIIYCIVLIFSCIVFISFLNMHYATDTYNIIDRGYKEYAIKYSLNDGRPVMCLISLLAEFLKLPIAIYITSLTFLAIFVSCVSIMLLKTIIEKNKKTKNIFEEIVLTIICWTTIFNFMFLENMQFAECFVMSMSILLFIIAANELVNKNSFVKSMLIAILGILFYQATIGVLPILTFVFSIVRNEENRIKFKNIILSAIICIIVLAINLIIVKEVGKIFGLSQTRFGNLDQLPFRILYVIGNIPHIIFTTANIFPKGVFAFFLFFVIIFSYLEGNRKVAENVLVTVIITIGATFAINIFTLSAFGTARTMMGIGMLVGNIFILIYTHTEVLQSKMKYFFSAICIIYFSIIVVNYISIMDKHTKVEKLTIDECYQIDKYMMHYEKKTNNRLKYIAIYNDAKPTYYYEKTKNFSALCIRPLSVEWGDNGAINFWCNTELIAIQPNEDIYIKYFKDKNWDKLSEEQFIFIQDTMHYCIY